LNTCVLPSGSCLTATSLTLNNIEHLKHCNAKLTKSLLKYSNVPTRTEMHQRPLLIDSWDTGHCRLYFRRMPTDCVVEDINLSIMTVGDLFHCLHCHESVGYELLWSRRPFVLHQYNRPEACCCANVGEFSVTPISQYWWLSRSDVQHKPTLHTRLLRWMDRTM
jgi:hypothetical protein